MPWIRTPSLIEDIYKMGGAKTFSKLDLWSGHHQMPLQEEDHSITAFCGANRIMWEWPVVPFGLKNVPPYFQRRMDQVWRDLPFCQSASSGREEHLRHLAIVFKRQRESGLKVHPRKCVFGAESIDFLGAHKKISGGSLQPQQDKLAVVRDLPSLTDVSSLRSALGLFSFNNESKIFGKITAMHSPSKEW